MNYPIDYMENKEPRAQVSFRIEKSLRRRFYAKLEEEELDIADVLRPHILKWLGGDVQIEPAPAPVASTTSRWHRTIDLALANPKTRKFAKETIELLEDITGGADSKESVPSNPPPPKPKGSPKGSRDHQ